jgi:hypothetical protein
MTKQEGKELVIEIGPEGQARIWEVPDFNQAVIDSQMNYSKALQLGFGSIPVESEIGVFPKPEPINL